MRASDHTTCIYSNDTASSRNGDKINFSLPDSIAHSFFKIANKLFREGSYFEAALIYEACALRYPTFPPYRLNRDKALSFLASQRQGRRPTLCTSSMPLDDYLIRVCDTLLDRHKLLKEAEWEESLASFINHPEYHLLCANYHGLKSSASRLEHLNHYFKAHGLREASFNSFSTESSPFLSKLQFHQGPAQHGDLVSVCMSMHNAQDTLPYAIRSILQQDYQDFELIIIDDQSSDDSASIAETFASSDSRIRVIHNTENVGTYINRNRAIQISKGRYFTVMDSDDFAHPQRLTIQLESMQNQGSAIATVGRWIRATTEGKFLFKVGLGGAYLHMAVATLMFELQSVKNRIGYYDSVRMGADMEYYERIRKVFGPESLTETKPPLALAFVHGSNLTSDTMHGICPIYGSSESRLAYRKAWQHWHTSSSQLFIGTDCTQRPFPAPEPLTVSASL